MEINGISIYTHIYCIDRLKYELSFSPLGYFDIKVIQPWPCSYFASTTLCSTWWSPLFSFSSLPCLRSFWLASAGGGSSSFAIFLDCAHYLMHHHLAWHRGPHNFSTWNDLDLHSILKVSLNGGGNSALIVLLLWPVFIRSWWKRLSNLDILHKRFLLRALPYRIFRISNNFG